MFVMIDCFFGVLFSFMVRIYMNYFFCRVIEFVFMLIPMQIILIEHPPFVFPMMTSLFFLLQ